MLSSEGTEIAHKHVSRLLSAALECVSDWPEVREAVAGFLVDDLDPVIGPQLPGVVTSAGGERGQSHDRSEG